MMADTAATSSNTGRPASETTPLLAPNVDEEQTTDASGSPNPSAAERTTPVVVATWFELISGLLCIIFGIACAVLRSYSPEGFNFPWTIIDMIPVVIFWAVIATFFAIYNLLQLRRVNETLPVLLNIAVDLVVACFLLLCVGQAWNSTSPGCSARYGPTLPPDALRRCVAWTQVVMPVIWSFVVLAGVVGFTAVFLLIARAILLFQRRTPGAPLVAWPQWHLPPGQLTFEFTVKLLRQDRQQDTTPTSGRSEPGPA